MADEATKTETKNEGKDKKATAFKPGLSVEETAKNCMAESKTKLKLDDNTRERVIKIKVGALNKIDADLTARKDVSDQEKGFWKKVKQTISTY